MVCRSRAQSLPVPAGANGEVTTQESIVPGLDFANHANEHSCRWTLWGNRKVVTAVQGCHADFTLAYCHTAHHGSVMPLLGYMKATLCQRSHPDCCRLHGHRGHYALTTFLCSAIQASGMHDSVSLVTTDTPHLSTDNELQITYGDKSNEELLFLYGKLPWPALNLEEIFHHCLGMTEILAAPV